MKVFLVVTIDVEPDCTTTWQYSKPLSFKGVSIGIKERLQPLFIKYGITPTYLINNVVLEHDGSVAILSTLDGQYELGAHLHPEFIEPLKQYSDYAGKRGLANCCFYPPDIEYEKIKNITTLFKDCFQYHPTSFRAGRFSAGPNTIKSLVSLGYKIDTSVTPHILWNDATREKPVDFRNAKEQPYFVKAGSILDEDTKGELLEVPVSIVNKKANVLKELTKSLYRFQFSLRKTIPVWLRPFYSTNEEFRDIVQNTIQCYSNRGFVVLNMMFHNVEVLPGLSPYCKNESDCRDYLNQLSEFFQYCNEYGIESIAISDLYKLYREIG